MALSRTEISNLSAFHPGLPVRSPSHPHHRLSRPPWRPIPPPKPPDLLQVPGSELVWRFTPSFADLCGGSILLMSFCDIFTVLVRRFTAVCRCFSYQVRVWYFKPLSSSFAFLSILLSYLVKRLLDALKEVQNLCWLYLRLWLMLVHVEKPVFCRLRICLDMLCRYYSLVEKFVIVYPSFGLKFRVTRNQFFGRDVRLSYPSRDRVCCLNFAFEVPLLSGLIRLRLVTLAVLVEEVVLKLSCDNLSYLSLESIESSGFRCNGALCSFDLVVVLSSYATGWSYVAPHKHPRFLKVSFLSGVASSPSSTAATLHITSLGIISLFNIIGMETRGPLYACICLGVMFASICYFLVFRFASIAAVHLASLALLSAFVNNFSPVGA